MGGAQRSFLDLCRSADAARPYQAPLSEARYDAGTMNSNRQAPRSHSWRGLALLAASSLLAAGCGAVGVGGKSSAEGDQPGQTKPNGPLFAECAGLAPEEIAQQLGATGARVQFRNSVTCAWVVQWSGMTALQASFTWYRGSPIGREESWEGRTRDGVQHVTIRGYPGFSIYQAGVGGSLCEIGVDFGNDFIEWSVELDRHNQAQQSCDGTRKLAELSLDRAKK